MEILMEQNGPADGERFTELTGEWRLILVRYCDMT